MEKRDDVESSQTLTEKSVLTIRETEYLSLAALGYKNKEIAAILFVTLSTVRKTLETISVKLNAKNRANAVAIAFIHSILNNCILEKVRERYKLM